jgi:signal peptidase I
MENPTQGQVESPLTIQEAEVSGDARQENPPATPTRPGGVGLFFRDLIVSAAVSILIIMFLYQPVIVEGTSMLPRLENDDRLFINKFIYHFESIERGDVVVFHYPPDPSKSYIKRVIALPGDRLWIDRGQVYVNGKPIAENYVPNRYRDFKSYPEIVLPPNEYFVLGDHRNIASDSRDFGPVDRSYIYGKAVLIYWPARDAGVVH